MKRRKSEITAVILLTLLSVMSCSRGILYTDTVKMNDEKWSMYDPAKFSCSINDTTGSYNLTVSVRTSTSYPYRNIHLFIVTSFPSGTSITDTIHGSIRNEQGEWMGKGVGDIRELTIPYKSNVFFPESGEYHFKVIQGMRDTVLNGVYDLGLKIAKRTS